MKYTIELTENQKKQMDLLCELAHRYIGFNPKLEPIKTTNAQATKEEWGKAEYKRGLEDFEKLFIYEHDYEQFIKDTYGSKEPDYNLYDLVARYGAKKVVDDFKKWQEEKKKAEEVKVGDEVKDLATDNIGVVMSIGKLIVYIANNGVYTNTLGSLEKTGKHYKEVEQLLSKLEAN